MADRPPPIMGPGRRAVFRPDHQSFGRFIKSDQMRDVTAEVAVDIMAVAAATTRRGKGPGPHTADAYKVTKNAGFIKVSRNIRVRVLVENTDPTSSILEFGHGKAKRDRMLAKAAAKFGDFKYTGESL